MTIQTQIQPTAAETALLEAFGGALGQLPGDAAITTQRSTLVQGIKTLGLPTRRREAWHYTDLRTLLRTVPAQTFATTPNVAAPLVAGSVVLAVVNGEATTDLALAGASVKTYAESLRDGSALKGLALRHADDAVARVNGGFVTDGYAVNFPEGYQGAAPVEFQFIQGGGFVNTRLPVHFGPGAKATVIERHLAGGEAASLISHVSDITLGAGAEITWIIQQQQGGADQHLGQIRVKFGRDAKLTLYVLNAGGKLVRQDIFVDVDGEGSAFTLRGINLLGGQTHTDVTMSLGHNVPDTTSTEIIRNVVFDQARGVFQGQIRVAPDAQKTDAKMSCNTLLLSDEAEFSAKPELEIFADDVQCGHGATVADISDTHLFYLKSRGITEPKARGLLVQAFVQEIVEELEDEALVEALEGVIGDWLDTHVG
jgi:Fe-S cluster assembly protein SufD